MDTIVDRYNKIKSNILALKSTKSVNIIAVSKTFSLAHIQPLIDYGHNHFGENKAQEAISKWTNIKKDNKKLNLHMIGKLQSNKAKDAVKIFDYIHSLDSQKLADILAKTQLNENKNLKRINLKDNDKKIYKNICENIKQISNCNSEYCWITIN